MTSVLNWHVIEVAAAMAVFLKLWTDWRSKHRCPYCGVDGGHREDCPRNGIEGL